MASIDTDGWELESAEDRHRAEPDTFQIPPLAERTQVKRGTMVKLLVLLLGRDAQGEYIQCERLWVTVKESSPDKYQGMLESEPVTSNVLTPGSTIEFTPAHIAAIHSAG